jgi:predicted nuclease with TOPRIM domain
MEYNKLISVTGFSGLFELVTSKTDGAIVRSLEDNTTKFVSSRIHQFSHLESIEVYTTDENVNLAEIFKAMDASAETLPSEKDNKAVKSYFEKVFPSMDFERVYSSDMKKMVRWFNVIKQQNIEIVLTEMDEEEEGNEG